MKYEKIDFNESFWKGKSKAEFIAHEKHHGLSEKQMDEAYDLLNPKRGLFAPKADPPKKEEE